jgi:sugar O-acyltransferase (sialic acid O-acetyltransferase NeuD family)
MNNKTHLYGASGHAKVIIDILNQNEITVESIVDDNPKAEKILGIKVVKTIDFDLNSLRNAIISIGNNKVRKTLSDTLKTNYSKAIHPKAILSKTAHVGEGTVIMAGAILNADAKIGKHCIINTAAVIEHDCNIDNFVHVSPNASLAGGVCIGEGAHVGINATIIQNITIGKWATIGAGAVVITNVPDYAVVVGNPARIIKFIKNE